MKFRNNTYKIRLGHLYLQWGWDGRLGDMQIMVRPREDASWWKWQVFHILIQSGNNWVTGLTSVPQDNQRCLPWCMLLKLSHSSTSISKEHPAVYFI